MLAVLVPVPELLLDADLLAVALAVADAEAVAVADGVEVAVGDCDVAVDVGVGLEGEVVGLDDVLPPPPDAGLDDVLLAGRPPCSVTTIPPGLNTICALHCPLGAALVAVAMTTMLWPAANVPECWLKVSQDTDGVADQDNGAVPVLRNRICTLSGSAARWFTLTKKAPEEAAVGVGDPAPVVAGDPEKVVGCKPVPRPESAVPFCEPPDTETVS